ncbi:hypothetical protein Kisp02_71580 [Kineosporia sp. NBRC 101731]|nr:hypothetical protein Kisp02_71580 [Kineosporia sp. NBRC 101731]
MRPFAPNGDTANAHVDADPPPRLTFGSGSPSDRLTGAVSAAMPPAMDRDEGAPMSWPFAPANPARSDTEIS